MKYTCRLKINVDTLNISSISISYIRNHVYILMVLLLAIKRSLYIIDSYNWPTYYYLPSNNVVPYSRYCTALGNAIWAYIPQANVTCGILHRSRECIMFTTYPIHAFVVYLILHCFAYRFILNKLKNSCIHYHFLANLLTKLGTWISSHTYCWWYNYNLCTNLNTD